MMQTFSGIMKEMEMNAFDVMGIVGHERKNNNWLLEPHADFDGLELDKMLNN